ncbi:CBU_0592 family membrane protein [Rubrobacter calidifluminis]|uniref:CBU_0592 family membrane protein n=1 Tax=Rubrobacter calidifluminis TaxID=1392640 RepID=UPI0023627133|nr:hypothetical protein [Rubrobacter calidifluminis]
MSITAIQLVSVVGSLLILAAYAANLLGVLSASGVKYSLLNLIGSGILSAIAVIEDQWGFLLLEGAWTLISAGALARLTFRRIRGEDG